MFVNEYGDKHNPLVLLLAPMMVSGADLYQLMLCILNMIIITSLRTRAVPTATAGTEERIEP